MSKTLIYTDKYQSENIGGAWKRQKEMVQQVINLYAILKLPALAENELSQLFNNTEVFVYDKLTGGDSAHLTFGTGENRTHLKVDKSQAMKLLSKPQGYENLLAAISAFSASCINGHRFGNESLAKLQCRDIGTFFTIDKKGKLQFTGKVNDIISEAGNYYVESGAITSLYNFIKDVSAAYYKNGIHKIHNFNSREINYLIELGLEKLDKPNETFIAKKELQSLDREYLELGRLSDNEMENEA